MFIPSLTEYVGELCFFDCESLVAFTSSSPSHLRKLLDLPSRLSGFVSIPDSIEVLSFHIERGCAIERVLTFGGDSRLRDLRAIANREFMATRPLEQVSSRSFKPFRTKSEFEHEAAECPFWF
jgi:hypothetical protein